MFGHTAFAPFAALAGLGAVNPIAGLPSRRPSDARKAHTYRGARRNVARLLNAAGLGGRFRGAFAITAQPWAAPIVEFLHAQPEATREQVVGAYMEATEQFRTPPKAKPGDAARLARLQADAEARQRGENLDGSPRRETVEAAPVVEPMLVADEAGALHEAEAPKAKKPRARKPAAPKAVTEESTPKAPRKRTAAPKDADAPAKPKAAPRRRAPASA